MEFHNYNHFIFIFNFIYCFFAISRRCAEFIQLQNELYKNRAELRNAQLDIENQQKRIEELEEDNLQLQMTSKLSISESQVNTISEFLDLKFQIYKF